MKVFKNSATAAFAAVALLLLASCSNNNVRNNDNENDTNVVDSRRYTDTTSNYITKDSGSINNTPAVEGTGIEQ